MKLGGLKHKTGTFRKCDKDSLIQTGSLLINCISTSEIGRFFINSLISHWSAVNVDSFDDRALRITYECLAINSFEPNFE